MQADIFEWTSVENVVDQYSVLSTFTSTAKTSFSQIICCLPAHLMLFLLHLLGKNMPEIFCISDVRESKTEW